MTINKIKNWHSAIFSSAYYLNIRSQITKISFFILFDFCLLSKYINKKQKVYRKMIYKRVYK